MSSATPEARCLLLDILQAGLVNHTLLSGPLAYFSHSQLNLSVWEVSNAERICTSAPGAAATTAQHGSPQRVVHSTSPDIQKNKREDLWLLQDLVRKEIRLS
jgi:hypothetical protein